MKITVVSIGAYGHVYPLMPLALACRDAGHAVTIMTGPPFLERLPLPTVEAYPPELTLDGAFAEAGRRHPELEGAALSMAMFGDVTAEQMLPFVTAQIEESGADLVIYEVMAVGAGVAASVTGTPAVAYAIGLSPMIMPMLHPPAIGWRRSAWTDRGLVPPPGPLLGAALLDPCPPSLRPAEAQDTLHRLPIRPVAFNEGAAPVPPWLLVARTRPRVYVTLGTVSFGAVEVLSRAVREAATLDVDVLVTVGPDGDPALLGELPDNVHVERFVAQSEVLRLVDVVVHHGGTGTVLSAYEMGVPQLLMPQGADQFVNVSLLTGLRAAKGLPNDAYRPGIITSMVEELLADGPERAAAGQLREEIAAMPPPAEVVAQLAELAAR